MKKIADFICKYKYTVVIVAFLLLIPALIGYKNTKVNYDILVYLPSDIETIKGEEILTDDFNMGAFSVAIIENMSSYDILKLEDKIKEVDSVEKVVSVNDISGTTIPLSVLPDDVVSKFKKGDTEIMLITFSNSTSDDDTIKAVQEIRKITKDNVKLGGMSSMVVDTMELSDSEITIYVVIAVVLCIIVLSLALDSYVVPFILLLNIGIAILYNMGTNIFLGDISYITKAISSVLQLGVTTDFSIFLYHKYMEEKKKKDNKDEAMSKAIVKTMTSVVGSSLTTIAGFLALCTMSLTLGKDIGIVMAKGVFLGVISVIVIFPAMLLVFDKYIEKTRHKEVIPKFIHLNDFIIKHYKKIFVIFLILLIPAYYGNKNTEVYYKLDKSLPDTLESSIANTKLQEDFNIVSPEMIIIDKDIKANTVNEMISEIEEVKGVDMVLSGSKLSEYGLSDNLLDSNITSIYKSDKYQMILVNSLYETATDELNTQIDEVNKIVKKYDKNGILAGEGPLTKDLITISDTDFHNVNYTSLAVIFVIMILVLKSATLPVILIFVIEFAIFVNMGIPFYMDVTIPFIASIVIGTIQLGATIDYAILMTTKYLEQRKKGREKKDAIKKCLDSSVNSIFVSGMCFFAATFGVAMYSKIDMISALCLLISRGAIISMVVVIFVLPSFLIIFDKLICKTTYGFKKEGKVNMNKNIKKVALFLIAIGLFSTTNVNALTKDETVFSHLDYNGKVKSTVVNEHLTNINKNSEVVDDVTNLKNILNINGNEAFTISGEKISFENKGNEITYSGEIDKELPINVAITYKLNGEDIKLSNLLGKSGRVEIKLSYTNNSSKVINMNGNYKTIYTPFVVTMGTIIPTKGVSNVEVSNGHITSTGTNNMIIALATPGLYQSLGLDELKDMNTITISYDVDNFKLNTIYNVTTTKLLDKTDLSKFDKLDDLYNKVNLLSNSSKELVNGANKLNEGITTAKEGSNKITSGLTEKIEELKNSSALSDTELTTITTDAGNTASDLITGQYIIDEETNTKISDLYPCLLNPVVSPICPTALQKNGEMIWLSYILNSAYSAHDNDTSMTQEDINEYKINVAMAISGLAGQTASTVATEVAETAKVKSLTELQGLAEYMTTLTEGINQISAGTNELASGLQKFDNEGISLISRYVNGDLKDVEKTTEELIKLGKEYTTYTMKDDETESSTKFILVVDKKEKKVTTKKTTTKKETKKSFFERIFKK